jgi:hypothetical protein
MKKGIPKTTIEMDRTGKWPGQETANNRRTNVLARRKELLFK